MLSITKDIDMTTFIYGGITKGIRRMAGGDSVYLSEYVSRSDRQVVTLSDNKCGCILPLEVSDNKSYLCDRTAYLCSEPSVDLDIAFIKRVRMGLFGGEGFVLERLTGNGFVFLHGYGEITRVELDDGDELEVMSSKVLALSTSISMDVKFVNSVNNVLFSGRGLFTTHLTGHGVVYLQSFSENLQ